MSESQLATSASKKISGRVLWTIVGLSFLDAISTDIGLRYNLITEANPWMSLVYEYHISIFYGVKLGWPTMLFAFQPLLTLTPLFQILFSFTIALYAIVASLHITWLVCYFVL